MAVPNIPVVPPTHCKVGRTLIWVALLLIASEVGLRARAYYRFGSSGLVSTIDEPDPLLGFRLRPGSVIDGAARSVHINRWGFRGPDVPKVKPPGTTRIAALGDSITFGMDAGSDEAVWVARMTAELNEASSIRPTRGSDATLRPTRGSDATLGHYDAINGGVRGYTLATSIRQLTDRIAPLGPDIVVVFQLSGDLTAHARRQFGPPDESAQRGSPRISNLKSSLDRFTRKHSLLRHLLSLNTVAFKAKYLAQERHDRVDERGVYEYEAQLQKLADLCRQRGWRLILCTGCRAFGDETAPTDQYTLAQSALAANRWLSLAGLSDGFERYNEAIRRVARRSPSTLVDLDRIVPKRREYFADAVHLSDQGHRLVGEAVARAILDTTRPPTSVASDPRVGRPGWPMALAVGVVNHLSPTAKAMGHPDTTRFPTAKAMARSPTAKAMGHPDLHTVPGPASDGL